MNDRSNPSGAAVRTDAGEADPGEAVANGDAAAGQAASAPAEPHRFRATRSARRQLGRWVRRVLLVLVLAAAVGVVVKAWMPQPVPVETAVAEEGELVVTVDEDGRTRVKDRYTVSAPISGMVGRIELRPGDSVEQAQLLARIVPVSSPLLDERTRTEATARVAAAEAALRQARAQVERAKVAHQYAKKEAGRERALAGQGVGTAASLDRALMEERARAADLASAEFASKVAAHEVQMTRAALGRQGRSKDDEEQMIVPSPVTGHVLRVIQESEGVIQAGAPLLELGDPKALEIAVDVLTSDAVNIEPGAPVSLEQWGGEPLRGRVRLIEPSAFTKVSALGVEEQRVNAVIDLDAPYEKWSSLMDGFRVEARIEVWRADEVLRVPSSALFRKEGGWAVFTVQNDTAQLRDVRIGRNNGIVAEVQDGLEVGTRVVVHPSDRVEDGTSVAYR